VSAAPDRRTTLPPGGSPAPERADGIKLRVLAEEVTERYAVEFPDEDERYDPEIWREWCVHDSQYLLQWAILDVAGTTNLDEQVGWLARVLGARDFPLDRLARTLELCGDVLRERHGRADVAERLRAVAATLS
jgi:hypothetical protein